MSSRILVKKMYIEKFRKLNDLTINIGKNLTLISGYNGIGKSNILSLIASGSGKKINKQLVDSNFQPEFYDFFYIDEKETSKKYNSFLYYGFENENEEEGFVKRLSLKDDTKNKRGIRIIPRLHNKNVPDKSIKLISTDIKSKYDVSPDSRVPIPTIYLSLSRLYPIGETDIMSNRLFPHNSFNTKNANKKYAEWYNSIIPNSIDLESSEVYEFQKTTTKKNSTYMDIQNTTIKTQSVGQDNIGNIISALIDFYLLSLEEDYSGGILCIDEIDVSLHPNIQINMIELLNRLSKELKLQIILSTHSLVLIKEIIKLKNKHKQDEYSLVYLRNLSYPMVSDYDNYNALKADLYDNLNFVTPKIKIYFEDPITQVIFNLLLESYSYILDQIKFNTEAFFENLKSDIPLDEDEKQSLESKILKFEKQGSILNHLESIDISLGCDNLLQLNEKDKYFNSVLILLDGDARLNPEKRPKIAEFLDDNTILKGFNTKKVLPNIMFLPNFFAPESYLYMVIFEFVNNQEKHTDFWRSLDNNPETYQYTRDRIEKKLIYKNLSNFTNDNIKKHDKYILKFVEESRIILHYYLNYKNIYELLDFMKDLSNSYNKVKQRVESSRYDV